MKRLVFLALRLVGVALVCFVLWRIQYRDILDPEGAKIVGSVSFGDGTPAFVRADGKGVEPLPGDWARSDRLRLGLFTLVKLSRKALLLFCVLAFGPITFLSIYRWYYLLRAVKVPTTFWESVRLSYIGFFFNSAVPGLTGGDLVKAFYIARQSPGKRVLAFMSVLVDRMIGLFVLGVLAAGVLLPRVHDPRFRAASVIVFLFVAGCFAFGVLFLSRRLRRWLRFEKFLSILPFAHVFTEVDRGISVYRDHPKTVWLTIFLSLLNHIAIVSCAVGMGRALGAELRELPVYEYFILVPVCSMLASIPALPGGWGVREGAFALFFGMAGVPGTQSVALSILIGLSQLAWSLVGGWFFLQRPDRVSAKELASFARQMDSEPDTAAHGS